MLFSLGSPLAAALLVCATVCHWPGLQFSAALYQPLDLVSDLLKEVPISEDTYLTTTVMEFPPDTPVEVQMGVSTVDAKVQDISEDLTVQDTFREAVEEEFTLEEKVVTEAPEEITTYFDEGRLEDVMEVAPAKDIDEIPEDQVASDEVVSKVEEEVEEEAVTEIAVDIVAEETDKPDTVKVELLTELPEIQDVVPTKSVEEVAPQPDTFEEFGDKFVPEEGTAVSSEEGPRVVETTTEDTFPSEVSAEITPSEVEETIPHIVAEAPLEETVEDSHEEAIQKEVVISESFSVRQTETMTQAEEQISPEETEQISEFEDKMIPDEFHAEAAEHIPEEKPTAEVESSIPSEAEANISVTEVPEELPETKVEDVFITSEDILPEALSEEVIVHETLDLTEDQETEVDTQTTEEIIEAVSEEEEKLPSTVSAEESEEPAGTETKEEVTIMVTEKVEAVEEIVTEKVEETGVEEEISIPVVKDIETTETEEAVTIVPTETVEADEEIVTEKMEEVGVEEEVSVPVVKDIETVETDEKVTVVPTEKAEAVEEHVTEKVKETGVEEEVSVPDKDIETTETKAEVTILSLIHI